MSVKVAYLGPAGTFSEEALRSAAGGDGYEPVAVATIAAVIAAVDSGTADLGLVPIENSIEGSVRATLDSLAPASVGVAIIGEYAHVVSPSLIGRPGEFDRFTDVFSHPQPLAQCNRFLAERLPNAKLHETASTAEGARLVGENPGRPWVAVAPSTAAELYGLEVLAEGIANSNDNVTRFVWIARSEGLGKPEAPASTEWRTTLVFAELGADHPGALVDALGVFAARDVNLTRIESRPAHHVNGDKFTSYMFFIDVEGGLDEPAIAEAVDDLRSHASSVKVLGSYPVGVPGLPPLG